MSQRMFAPIVLVPALLIAGCTGTQNRQLESVHQPVVSRASYVFDVATDGRGLATGEDQRLAGWMRSLRVGYGDRVAIDAASTDSPAARAAVAATVSHYGLLLADGAPVTPAPRAAGPARSGYAKRLTPTRRRRRSRAATSSPRSSSTSGSRRST